MAYLPQVQFQPYIKPYNGSSNAELADTVKQLTQRYDDNLQAGTALDILAGQTASMVGHGDRGDALSKIEQVKKQLSGIVDSEQGYYSARPQIAQLAAKFKGDPDLAVMIANKQKQDAEDKVNMELTARGQKILNFNKPGFKTISYDKDRKKVYNDYAPASEAMHNYHDAQAKYFDQIQADGSSGGLSHSAMQGFLQTGSFTGISGTKIKRQADRALESYLQTPEGNQQLRNYTQLQGMTPEQATKAIQHEMISTGMERVFSHSQTNYMQDPMFGLEAKMALQAAKGKKSADGSPYGMETEKSVPMTNKDDVDAAVNSISKGDTKFSSLSAVQKDMVWNAVNRAKAQLGPSATNEQIHSEATKFLHGRSDFNTAPRYYAISGTKNINDENNTFQNGNYTARLYQDIDNPGKTMNWEQMKKKYNLEDDDNKVAKSMNVSGFYHEDHPFTVGLQGSEADRFIQPIRLTIQTKDGTKTVVAGSDYGSTKTNEFRAAKFIHEVYLGDKNGRGKRIVADGKVYFVRPTGQSVNTANGPEAAYEVASQDGESRLVGESTLLNNINPQ